MSKPTKRSKRKPQGSASGLLSEMSQRTDGLSKKHVDEALRSSQQKKQEASQTTSLKASKRQSVRHETSIEKRHSMNKTDGSGCGKIEKGYATDAMFVCEGKSSRSGSINVTPAMLDKLWRDGKKMGKIPFIDLDTITKKEPDRPRHFVVIPAPVWQLLKKKLTEEEFNMLRPR